MSGSKKGSFPDTRRRFSNLYVGLVHYPVYDPERRVICSAVTNLDVHDMARCAKTFGIPLSYVINPLDSQRDLVQRIIDHWTKGAGAAHNPCRKEALKHVRVKTTLVEVTREISNSHGLPVTTVATDARWHDRMISCTMMRELLASRERVFLLLFGTGWGLAQEVFDESNYVLTPIEGVIEYNHLSVRSAMAIILDRLTRIDTEEEADQWIP